MSDDPNPDGIDSLRNRIAELEAERAFECKARKSQLPEPADCDWPICGCDPYAQKVLDALDETWTAGKAERDSIRDKALEEAAGVVLFADAKYGDVSKIIAAIRALKGGKG